MSDEHASIEPDGGYCVTATIRGDLTVALDNTINCLSFDRVLPRPRDGDYAVPVRRFKVGGES